MEEDTTSTRGETTAGDGGVGGSITVMVATTLGISSPWKTLKDAS